MRFRSAVGVRDAVDVGRGFENKRAETGLCEFESGGETGGVCSDHEVRCVVGEDFQNIVSKWD